MKHKLIIAGSRGFNDYELLKHTIRPFLHDITEVVSGTAQGADTLGEQFAHEFGVSVRRFPANWDAYGRRAGYLRNVQMAKYATACIVFWDGKSKGTEHMINIARKHGLKLKIVKY